METYLPDKLTELQEVSSDCFACLLNGHGVLPSAVSGFYTLIEKCLVQVHLRAFWLFNVFCHSVPYLKETDTGPKGQEVPIRVVKIAARECCWDKSPTRF